MNISLIRRAVVLALAAALTMFIGITPAQSAGAPFNELAAQHEELQDAIADLQESVDALGQLAPPCGAGTVGQRFVVLDGGEEVCDNTTALVWQQQPDNSVLSQPDALAHCPTLGAGSRLPEIKELLSLVDYSQFNPALPAGHPFSNVQLNNYWSATRDPRTPTESAWSPGFRQGRVTPFAEIQFKFVWCVRDGP